MLARFRSRFMRVPALFRNVFFVTGLVFTVWMLFFDENNMLNQWQRRKELRTLKEKEKYYQEEIKKVDEQLEEITTNRLTQEKYAREKYLMKRDSEDIFLIKKTNSNH